MKGYKVMINNILLEFALKEELDKYVTEAYHISDDIENTSIDLSKKIVDNIKKNDKNKVGDGIWEIKGTFEYAAFENNMTIKYTCYNFLNNDVYNNKIGTIKQFNGIDTHSKLFNLTVISISGRILPSTLNETIQHELHHLYQSIMSKSHFNDSGNLYNFSVKNIRNNNEYMSKISWIIYLSRKFEIEAASNGTYAYIVKQLSNNNSSSISEFIQYTQLWNNINDLNILKGEISNNTNNVELLDAIKQFSFYHININKLINLCDTSIQLMKRKLGEITFRIKKDLKLYEYSDKWMFSKGTNPRLIY